MADLRKQFREFIDLQAGPLGPYRSLEDADEERRRFAVKLNEEWIDAGVQEIGTWYTPGVDTDDRICAATFIFFEFIKHNDKRILSEAVLRALEPDGPPALLNIWEMCGTPDQTPEVLAKIDRFSGNEDLDVALAGALGVVGGDGSREALVQMRTAATGHELIEEIDAALARREEEAAPG